VLAGGPAKVRGTVGIGEGCLGGGKFGVGGGPASGTSPEASFKIRRNSLAQSQPAGFGGAGIRAGGGTPVARGSLPPRTRGGAVSSVAGGTSSAFLWLRFCNQFETAVRRSNRAMVISVSISGRRRGSYLIFPLASLAAVGLAPAPPMLSRMLVSACMFIMR
jgi:hypothetical protein